MKKYAIISVLAAVVVLAHCLLQRTLDIGESFTYGHTARITTLARDLIERRTSNLIIGVHPALYAKLDELDVRATGDYSPSVVRGDASAPIGDGQGTQHFFIIRDSDNQRVLGVRLRYERATRTYHVLGFWTPTNA